MKLPHRIAIAFTVLATTAACSSADYSPPSTAEDVTADAPSEIKKAQSCSANPPVNARCSAPCPSGFQVNNGKTSCACCAVVRRDPCSTHSCAQGTHCTAPADVPVCVADLPSRDPCANVVCPSGKICTAPADVPSCN